MKDGYFAIWMNEICTYYGIEIKNIFKTSKELAERRINNEL